MGVGDQEGNEDTPLEISALAAGGRGVARQAGRVWFVPGTVPGDEVLARPWRSHPRHVDGSLVRVVRPSALRRPPPCPLQPRCGGCPWMVLDEAEQRRWKERVLADAVRRIAGLPDLAPEPLRSPGPALGYRNRVELVLAPDPAGQIALGFHAARSENIVDVERCLLQDEASNAVLARVREILLPRLDSVPRGLRLLIQRSAATGEILVALWETESPFPRARRLATALLRLHPDVRGVIRLRGQPGRRGGTRARTLSGRSTIEETIGGTSFHLPAATFTQVNPAAADELIALATELAGDVRGAPVLDLYGGIGAYAFSLARSGARTADICDANPDALACGKEAATRHGVGGLRFHHADAARFLAARPTRAPWRVVVANPPRSGLDRNVASALAHCGAERIVLVSCDPATLARDLKRLAATYRPRRIIPLDLFPQTPHIETICLLEPAPK